MASNSKLLFFLLITALSLFQSCNPDCDALSRANINMEPKLVLPGSEFLLRSSPSSLLKERTIFIDDPSDNSKKLALISTFAVELNGVIATLPAQASSMAPIYVEDPDCKGDFIYVNDLQIENEDFFFSSDLFVVPPLPIIIIPTPPPAPPVNITNAWITPYRQTYCIWFVPEKDDNGNEKKELRPLRPDDEQVFADSNPVKGSHEFVICGEDQRHVFANVNPVSGIVDKENNFIQIRIDRSSKGLGIEQFTGQFIDPGDQIPNTNDWRTRGIPCAGVESDQASDYMLLTSTSTGQQLLMLKAIPD